MASPTLAPLFQQPVCVRWILSETLTGLWLEASDDGDFAGSSVAPPSNELASPCLLRMISRSRLFVASQDSSAWLFGIPGWPAYEVLFSADVLLASWGWSWLLLYAAWSAAICKFTTIYSFLSLDATSLLQRLSLPDAGHCLGFIRVSWPPSIVAMDTNSLGEALSPHDWATVVVFSVIALLS
ncbi:hypothetical protein POTOM_010843 [Populus tomentosa]|uniref:Uncharacterized protein n=1 Tax=Populus tomentosa TaxID=118781 RepID=A0A8X8DB19_POPTO|nr:hypothetical protein POTOM_010843 [Populus tomentosa]